MENGPLTSPIVFALGTRPEIIKCAPVIHALARRGAPLRILHTGQHYAANLDSVFFGDLDLPAPGANVEVGSLPPAEQLAAIIARIAPILSSWKPSWVLVQGDTNSVLGSALAAHKLDIPVAHLEAGLRSDDWSMPEEGNRVLTGRLAALHLCPTALQAERLASEGITRGVHVVGNTIVDAVFAAQQRAASRSNVLTQLNLKGKKFGVVTLHRPSNVDDPARLSVIVASLGAIARERGLDLVWPVHPRTRRVLDGIGGIERAPWVITEPLGYLDFQGLLGASALVLTDSGGLQEEACILGIPCVTLRANTERPETIEVGSNALCPEPTIDALRAAIETVVTKAGTWKNPFGDGRTGERVADLLLSTSTRRRPSGEP